MAKTKLKTVLSWKLIKGKSDKLYVKWKSGDDYFDSWIGEKDMV